MRSEQELRANIAVLKATYHEKHDSLTQVQAAKLSESISAVKDELDALLSVGAMPCPVCQRPPKVMLKRAGYEDKDGDHSPVYEAGCLNGCGHVRASSAARVVEKWNAKVEAYVPPAEEPAAEPEAGGNV